MVCMHGYRQRNCSMHCIPVVNAWLAGLAAREAGRHKTDQDPTAVFLPDHQRSAAVALAGVLAAVSVAGAQHLGVQVDGDAAFHVPTLTLVILDQWNIHYLE